MKTENRKKRVSKLSIKIILTLFASLLIVLTVMYILFGILQAAGIARPDAGDLDAWVRTVLALFQVATGLSILTLFAFAINKIVVKRIVKLKQATEEVAKGNLGVTVELNGKDELSDLTESFNKMSAELKANEYLSKEFVRNISHEFKTPISAIRAYAELLDGAADKGQIDMARLKDFAGIIMKESDRLSLMSKSVLQLSLLDSTTMIKKDDTFKPSEQVGETLRLMQAKIEEKNLTLDLALEDISVTSNEQLLHQVWQNLISNAIKFSNDGGVIKIVVTRHGENGVYFEITDAGVGIKDDDKDKIFDHFYMADESRNTDGSGLGLAITKKILAKLGGEIGFESGEGKGAKFFVRL